MTIFRAVLAVVISTLIPSGYAQDGAKIGDVVFEKPFDLDGVTWSPRRADWARFIPDEPGGYSVEITAHGQGEAGAIGNRDVFGNIDKSKASTFLLNTNLSKVLEKLKGYELEIEVGVKVDHLPPSTKPWEGVRIAMGYRTPTGPYNHAYYNVFSGSFAWRNVSYRTRVPSDMSDMGLSLGLIAPSGTVSFRRVKITVSDIPLTMKTPLAGTAYRGHTLPRLRGFVTGIAEPGSEPGRKVLSRIANDWQANVAKLWFGLKGDLRDIDPKLEEWMASVDGALATARQEKIHLILHFASGWSVKEHGGNQLFYEKPEYAEKFVAAWRSVAQRFKGRKEIYAFELLNESQVRMPIAEGCPDYPELMERAAKAINEIDPDRAIIIQTEEWWGPKAFYKMRPINAKNIIYALHFYSPFAASHQGVESFQAGQTSWMAHAFPGTTDGVKWDREMLKRELQAVREFQQAYNVQIIVSEFGCVRWALGNSRQKLLADMIDIFEGYGWDWLYHTYPGWHGWSPELGNDPWNEKRPETPTTTEVLLKGWFAKNQRPTFPDLPPKD